jgi:hypothetical protein
VFVVGLILAFALFVFGVGTALRQRRTLARLREERFLPSDELAYLRGQVRRRLVTSAIVTFIGLMIGWTYLSGTEARATEIAERAKDTPEERREPSDEDKQFVRQYGYFWMAVLLLVFLAVMCAVFDFWATRRYWMAQYRIIKEDHEAKLRRDLAVYRQAKDNDRMSGLGNSEPADDSDDTPPPS